MFGRFVFSFLFSLSGWAAQTGTVVVDEALVYVEADFDAKVMATVKLGETYQISNKTQGPFYRIKLKKNLLGWISSIDIKPGVISGKALPAPQKREKKAEPLDSYTSDQKTLDTFALHRHQGFFLQHMFWKEKTMNKTRQDQLLFYGWNWTGFDTLVQGPFYIDTRLMMSFQVPEYYEKVTGVKAEGWILKAQTSLISANPAGDNFLFHYGFGVVSTYSHFNAGVIEGGAKKKYALDDLTMGLAIPIGMSLRLGPLVTQIFYQYYVENTQTSGVSLSLNWRY